MVAKPVALIIQRNGKQVASFQGLQNRLALLLLVGNGVAQRATQPLENGGLEQEAPDTFGLTLQDLFDQIVHRSEEHTSELQSRQYLVCRLLLEKKKRK